LTIAILLAAMVQAESPALAAPLEPLGSLVDCCWRGEFDSGERDTVCFEAVDGGRQVRDRNELIRDDPVYSGQTLYGADAAGGLAFTDANSDGTVIRGAFRGSPGRLDSGEHVYRLPDGSEARLWSYCAGSATMRSRRSPSRPIGQRSTRR
jgi:hypothetical protein